MDTRKDSPKAPRKRYLGTVPKEHDPGSRRGNSVLQYIDAAALEASVREMARSTKPGRHLIIGGICDPAFESEIKAAVSDNVHIGT